MGLQRGRLWWPVVALLLTATVGSIVNCVNAQANAVQNNKEAQVGKVGSNLSPLNSQDHEKLHPYRSIPIQKYETRLKDSKEPSLPINLGHIGLNDVKRAPKRRVISKREAKKPKNTKRRVKFNKKELEMKLQQQEKDGSEVKTKDDSKVDTSEVLSSSNSLIPEFSDLYMPWNLPPRPTKSRMPKKSEAKSHPSEISTCEDPTEEMYDPPKRYEKEVIFED